MKYHIVASIALLTVIVALGFHRRRAPLLSNQTSETMANLAEARTKAREIQKFFMVQFGADWCSDCLELSKSLEQAPMPDYLRNKFVVFNVDVGEFNKNLDVAKSLAVDVTQGIPVAVIFPPSGTEITTRRGIHEILAYVQRAGGDQ